MTSVRRPRPGPRPRGALRRSARVRGSARRGPGAAPAGVGLTTRAAVLGLVLCALVVSAALPLREYLSQRGQVARLEQAQAAQRARVASLEQQRARLDDPAYVASLARERLHYVLPGETTYVVLGGPAPASGSPATSAGRPAGPDTAWWSQLWGSVRSADGATAPAPAR